MLSSVPHVHDKPGQVDYTVEVFVVHGDRVLLRLHDKFGIWLSVGGHVELHEDPPQAAVREVREEVGLEVALDDSHMLYRETKSGYVELPPPVFMCRVAMSETHDHVTMTYFALATTDAVVPSADDRSDAWRWVTRVELADPALGLSDSIRFYAETALDRLAPPCGPG
jgi:8-oxo-dGTP pyrophosphatase MutT (NUDIX family)